MVEIVHMFSGHARNRSRLYWFVGPFLALVLLSADVLGQERKEPAKPTVAAEKSLAAGDLLIQPIRTDDPRQTLASLVRLSTELEDAWAAYDENRDRVHVERLTLILEQLVSLIDLSDVPTAARRHVGFETLGYVLDILGRVELPPLSSVPDADALESGNAVAYRIPETPLSIARIDAGPREREFLFDQRTVSIAPRFYQGIRSMPLRSALPIDSWTNAFRQITGPVIPVSLVSAIPESLKKIYLDTPVWKIIAAVVITLLMILFLMIWYRVVVRITPENRILSTIVTLLIPTAAIAVVRGLKIFFADELTVTGRFSKIIDITETLLVYLALSWIFWLLARTIIEAINASLDSSEADLDSNMLRLIGHILGTIGVVVILAIGAHSVGLPVMSIVAGLGLGGLAVALAIRPTLENLIGGFVLYLDKPIRVGDYCAFDDQIGTVEAIGIRSTQVRALDRTLITIPNAQFADTRLINWARADQMLINETIGLRYETDADQLRFVLAKIREMYHGHPRIDDETVRVRFSGYGACSLDISIRVYAMTREWNDYYAIKEDVLLRIKDIVEQAGTGFAFPSQTVYLGRDDGLATDLGEKARSEVAAWRRTGRLPFPRFAKDKVEAIKGKLAYPPPGSPDFYIGEEKTTEAREGLSAEPASEELQEPER